MISVLPDLLRPNLSVVFCGTAAGTVSAGAEAYYAHHHNKFWSIIHETGLTPVKLKPHEFGELLDFKIGLADLVKDVHGNAGVVRRATEADCAALRAKIETLKPSFPAFTSKNAGKQFLGGAVSLGAQLPIGGTKVFVLPSTSLAARWQWAETFEYRHNFAEEVVVLLSVREEGHYDYYANTDQREHSASSEVGSPILGISFSPRLPIWQAAPDHLSRRQGARRRSR